MPNEDGLFTQAEVEKAVKARIAEMKGQRDTARNEAAEHKKSLGEMTKAHDAYKITAGRADEFEAQVGTVQGTLDALRVSTSRDSIVRDALGARFDAAASYGLIDQFSKATDAGEFKDWMAAQVEGKVGLVGMLLAGDPAVAAPPNGAGPPINTPPAPKAPAVNGGAGTAPPAPPSMVKGSYAHMPPAEWQAFLAGGGS